VLGAGDDLFLQRGRQVAEVVGVAGDPDDEAAVSLGVDLGLAQRLGGDDVELDVVAVGLEVDELRCRKFELPHV